MKYPRIKSLREERNLSQKDIANLLQTTQQHYSRIENGSTEISCNRIKQLATFYNTSIDYIVGLTDCKDPYPTETNNQ